MYKRQLADLPSWKKPQELLSTIRILAIERHGIDDIENTLQNPQLQAILSKKQSHQILMERILVPSICVRAKQIREAIAAGHSTRYRIPRDVEQFIIRKQLYRTAEEKNSNATF